MGEGRPWPSPHRHLFAPYCNPPANRNTSVACQLMQISLLAYEPWSSAYTFAGGSPAGNALQNGILSAGIGAAGKQPRPRLRILVGAAGPVVRMTIRMLANLRDP